ncbi:hypothetical protein Goe25_00560 [Bacillus phage vB_BsuM-Goe25]|nr:hypothetical protein Goe25_00560 [Bacillus phage vB_BsuM-Goe25]
MKKIPSKKAVVQIETMKRNLNEFSKLIAKSKEVQNSVQEKGGC